VRKRKALDWLLERVEIVDEDGRPIDRADLEVGPDSTSPAQSEAGEGDTETHETDETDETETDAR
jgi:hypothetical protein